MGKGKDDGPVPELLSSPNVRSKDDSQALALKGIGNSEGWGMSPCTPLPASCSPGGGGATLRSTGTLVLPRNGLLDEAPDEQLR